MKMRNTASRTVCRLLQQICVTQKNSAQMGAVRK